MYFYWVTVYIVGLVGLDIFFVNTFFFLSGGKYDS